MGIGSSLVKGAKSLLPMAKAAPAVIGAGDVLGSAGEGALTGATLGAAVPLLGETGISEAAGAVAGGAIGAGSKLWQMMKDHPWATVQLTAGALPVIKDVLESGPDPKKLDIIKNARDARAEQMMGADPSMNRQKATDAANAELAPFIEEASRGPTSMGDKFIDGLGFAADVKGLMAARKLGKLAGMGKNTNANVPAPGGPKTESEGINGVDTSTKNLTSTSMPMDAGNFKSASRADAENGSLDRVSGQYRGNTLNLTGPEPETIHDAVLDEPGRGFSMNSPRLTMNGQTGGTSPIDRDELTRIAMKAKMMQNARGIPGMSGVAIPMGGAQSPMMALGDSMHGQTLNRLDAERMRQMQYGVNGG